MSILLIDDSAVQRAGLAKLLREEGFTDLKITSSAADGLAVLEREDGRVDLILSDLNMPDINGIEACRRVKAVEAWRDIPIIMVTTSDDEGDLQEAFEAGAIDYITKPPSRIELSARVRSALRLKHEIDARKAREAELREEHARSEWLLLNILPQPIAERLKHDPTHVIAERFEEVTVLFADLVGFTAHAAERPPEEVVELLNSIFSSFDALAQHHGLEKIKTIGDAYMVVAGVPMPRADHAQAIAAMALDMLTALHDVCGDTMQLRIGIHTGAVVAGVIGRYKFSYDLWGDTVNLASRMEATGCPGGIQISEAVYVRLQGYGFQFEAREEVTIKGRGTMMTYWLVG